VRSHNAEAAEDDRQESARPWKACFHPFLAGTGQDKKNNEQKRQEIAIDKDLVAHFIHTHNHDVSRAERSKHDTEFLP
jgi:hypothetical protein